MARVFRFQQVNGDGSSAVDQVFPYFPDLDPATGKPYCDDKGQPCVEITLRPVTKAVYREAVKAHTTQVPNGTGVMLEQIDWDGVNADIAVYAVVAWRGFVGADDRPLACLDATKRLLDSSLQVQIRNRAMYAQPVEVTAESFRQPAGLGRMVGGLREDHAVLSTRHSGGTQG